MLAFAGFLLANQCFIIAQTAEKCKLIIRRIRNFIEQKEMENAKIAEEKMGAMRDDTEDYASFLKNLLKN